MHWCMHVIIKPKSMWPSNLGFQLLNEKRGIRAHVCTLDGLQGRWYFFLGRTSFFVIGRKKEYVPRSMGWAGACMYLVGLIAISLARQNWAAALKLLVHF